MHNVLDACIPITWGSGRGLGPGIPEFFWPQIELAYRLVSLSQGPKNIIITTTIILSLNKIRK